MNHRFWLHLTLFIALSGPSTAYSQVLRVDKYHLRSDSAKYVTGSVEGQFSLDNRSLSKTQPLVYTRLSLRSDILYLSRNTAWLWSNAVDYLSSTSTPAVSTGHTHLRLNFNRLRRISEEVYFQAQYDQQRRMPRRLLAGGGARFSFLDHKKADLHGGAGLMMEWEHWQAVEGDPSSLLTRSIPKFSGYLSGDYPLGPHTRLLLWGLLQTGWDGKTGITRTRYAADVSLKFSIAKKLDWVQRFTWFYDVRPVIEINSGYYTVTSGLKYKF